MQLAGPGVIGPPADRDGAITVLREAIAVGITHIDTSDAYGPRTTNHLIREALDTTPMSVALAWLLHRSPNILLIAGTSSIPHLHENITGARLPLSNQDLAELDTIQPE